MDSFQREARRQVERELAEAAQVAGEGTCNVEVEGGAVRSGGTSFEGQVDPSLDLLM